MANISDRTEVKKINFFTIQPPEMGPDLWKTGIFDFRTPVSPQETNLNKLIVGDILLSDYNKNNTWRKLESTDTATTINRSIIGILYEIWDSSNQNINYSRQGSQTLAETGNGHTFTEDGGFLRLYVGLNPLYRINPRELFIHVNSTPNTRVNLWGNDGDNFATYCTGSGILANTFKLVNNDLSNPLVVVKS
jgi:hypothetical protein